MNLNDNPTAEQLRELLRPWDDLAAHHVLWVDHSGEVHITELERQAWRPPPAPQEILDNALVRFDTFWAGKGYVGPEAAADDEWITGAFNWLMRDWAAAKGKGTPVLTRV